MQKTEFEVGETRYVRVLITAENNKEFSINSASYELITEAGTVETTRDCGVDGHTIMALVSPAHTGRYRVKILYRIGDEELIEIVEVVVI